MPDKAYESEHYIFHYDAGTKAEQDIWQIAAYQEACFRHICAVLDLMPPFKIEYHLCTSPEQVGHLYGDDNPCNGFAAYPNQIYAVYNEDIQCIGFHEDAHIISDILNCLDCPAVCEGLAMYFDHRWWGISNMDWAIFYRKTGRYIGIDKLLDEKVFYSVDCSITYPIMGAFTAWLIERYGMPAYKCIYKQNDIADAMIEVLHKTPEELNRAFEEYIGLFTCDPVLEARMENMLSPRPR